MPILQIGPSDALFYQHFPPTHPDGFTFVFFNALTSDTSTWESVIAPRLRAAGHGTLCYNMRGQTDSPFSPGEILDQRLIVEDARRLLEETDPVRSILVGLSIGGLFSASTWLDGAQAEALVLINTLRENGPRLRWISDSLLRTVEIGGLGLFRDLFMPLLMNADWLGKNRADFLSEDADYAPLDRSSGHYKLLSEAGRTSNWDLPYEKITLPTLVVTGLQDHLFLERDSVDRLSKRMPDAKCIELEGAGHLIPAEQPEQLADILIEFAREII